MRRSRFDSSLVMVFLLAVWLDCVTADRVTAGTDYGFGALWIEHDGLEDTLSRCDNVTIKLGGGFAPYYLSAQAE